VIDGCVFHDWTSATELFPYLSEGWRETIARPGDLAGALKPVSSWLYPEPQMGALKPRDAWTYRTYEALEQGVLKGNIRDRIVLGYSDGLLTTASPYHYLASALVTATNDWTIAEWLSKDERLYGMVLVYAGIPEHAATEIRRLGANRQMVAVAIGANGLGNLFGHPIYDPIYAAAAEVGLPIVIQIGSDAAADMGTEPIAGGLPTTFGEYRALSVQASMTHVASLITEGTFEKFPSLKVLILGGGVTWVPPYLWRLDYWFKTLERESPWLKKLPSAYFAEHVRLSTYSLETVPTPGQLELALSALPGIERSIIYTSGAPATDALEPREVAARLPSGWHEGVFHDNAMGLFRWPDAALSVANRSDEMAKTGGQ
jgi:predicted TIM-barrel fold metal-dependent hydrolase